MIWQLKGKLVTQKYQIYSWSKCSWFVRIFPWSITVLLSSFLEADIMMKTVRVTMIQYIFTPGKSTKWNDHDRWSRKLAAAIRHWSWEFNSSRNMIKGCIQERQFCIQNLQQQHCTLVLTWETVLPWPDVLRIGQCYVENSHCFSCIHTFCTALHSKIAKESACIPMIGARWIDADSEPRLISENWEQRTWFQPGTGKIVIGNGLNMIVYCTGG